MPERAPARNVRLPRPRAVIFTHFPSLVYRGDREFQEDLPRLLDEYSAIFKAYLECNADEPQIAVVYPYIDHGFKAAILEDVPASPSDEFRLSSRLLQQDNVLKDLVKSAESRARSELGIPDNSPPVILPIGLAELLELLNELVYIDPALTTKLRGPARKFTYDAPKFIEAVIRIARGHTSDLAWDPVIRLDEDVTPSAESLRNLIDAYISHNDEYPFYFFSGTYGSPQPDWLNDFAVRVHWFTDDGTTAGDPLDDRTASLIRAFLADLNELGATQLAAPESDKHYSSALRGLLNSGRAASVPLRGSAQVISGAGLVMSTRAIRRLPPFMNFDQATVWVDDHLKRRLHEAINDLGPNHPESIPTVRFSQDRYPRGVSPRDQEFAAKLYFDRLLRGCVLRRLITDLDGAPTKFSELIGDIVRYRDPGLDPKRIAQVGAQMMIDGFERYDEVVHCWKSPEFSGTASFSWATSRDPGHRSTLVSQVVQDALNYVDLTRLWPVYVSAMDKLSFRGSRWLFVGAEH